MINNPVALIVNLILGIVGIVAFFWMMVGGLIGVIWIIKYLADQNKKKVFNWKKWIVVTFGGGILLVINFILYAIYFVVLTLTGADYVVKLNKVDVTKYGEKCKLTRTCGEVSEIDCGAAVDGPYYYVDSTNGKELAKCGEMCLDEECQTKCMMYANQCK